MRKVSLLLLVALLVGVLAGCTVPRPRPPPRRRPTPRPIPPADTSAEAKPYIPVISKGFQHQFWQAVRQGSEEAAAEFNVDITFEGPETEAQVDKQMEMLQTAIDKKPAAICFAAVDSKAAIPLLEKAQAAGIPVIGFDSGVDSDIPVTTASTDNIAAAAAAADKMAELIGGAGEVAVIAHDQTSITGRDRVKGFTDQIAAKYPDITVVDVQYGAGDPLKSTDIVKAVIQGHPELKGYFGANEGSMTQTLIAHEPARGKVVREGIQHPVSGAETGIKENPLQPPVISLMPLRVKNSSGRRIDSAKFVQLHRQKTTKRGGGLLELTHLGFRGNF